MHHLYCFYIVLILLAGLVDNTLTRIIFLAAIGIMMLIIHVMVQRQVAQRALANLVASLICGGERQADFAHNPTDDQSPLDHSATAE